MAHDGPWAAHPGGSVVVKISSLVFMAVLCVHGYLMITLCLYVYFTGKRLPSCSHKVLQGHKTLRISFLTSGRSVFQWDVKGLLVALDDLMVI